MIKIAGLIVGVIAFSSTAHGDPVCMQVDIPGAQQTQGWQVNDHGEFVVSSEIGSFVYANGAFRALPAPPPSSGLGPADLGALAINNAGTLAGPAIPPATGVEESFYLEAGVYTFFSYPSADFPNTEVRGLNDLDISAISASAADGSSAIGVVYNPDGNAPWAPGFTVLHPTLDGEEPWYVLPGRLNTAGTVVGSAWFGDGVHGFIADPSGATVFRVGDARTRARDINDAGTIVGTVTAADGSFTGFVRDASGDRLVTCPAVTAAGGEIFLEGINNEGVMSGDIIDADGNSHGLVMFASASDALADLAGAVRGAGPGASLSSKLRHVQDEVAAGKNACADLQAFTSEVRAQSGKKLAATAAAAFTSEANAIAAALGCR